MFVITTGPHSSVLVTKKIGLPEFTSWSYWVNASTISTSEPLGMAPRSTRPAATVPRLEMETRKASTMKAIKGLIR